MKIKATLVLVLIMFYANTYSQKRNKSEISSFNISKTKLNNAFKYKDYMTAIDALHEILASNPEKTAYKDTLLSLYVGTQQIQSATYLALEMEKEGNKTLTVLDVIANYYENSNKSEQALSYYQEINNRNENLHYLNKIAMLQFGLKKNDDCLITLNKIILDPKAEKEKTKLHLGNNKFQDVPYAAIAYNIAGLMSYQLENLEEAKQHFQSALNIFPEFEMAKTNIASLNE